MFKSTFNRTKFKWWQWKTCYQLQEFCMIHSTFFCIKKLKFFTRGKRWIETNWIIDVGWPFQSEWKLGYWKLKFLRKKGHIKSMSEQTEIQTAIEKSFFELQFSLYQIILRLETFPPFNDACLLYFPKKDIPHNDSNS